MTDIQADENKLINPPRDEWRGSFLFTAKVINEMSEREYYWFTGDAERIENSAQRKELIADLRSAGFVVTETTDQNGDYCHNTVR